MNLGITLYREQRLEISGGVFFDPEKGSLLALISTPIRPKSFFGLRLWKISKFFLSFDDLLSRINVQYSDEESSCVGAKQLFRCR